MRASIIIGMLAATLAPASAYAADAGFDEATKAAALESMGADERAGREAYFTSQRYELLAYEQIFVPIENGRLRPERAVRGSNAARVTTQASNSYVYNGLYISISASRDTEITFEYRYFVQAYFDWQGSTQPWNGTLGDDGFTLYWGNGLGLVGDYFWGKYRDGSSILGYRESAPPNCCVGWMFLEKKSGSSSIADFGWLNSTVNRATFQDQATNFTVKYLHTWGSYNYSFSWGSGPSVSMSPSTSSQGISTYVNIRT